jgi:hypothetical protein
MVENGFPPRYHQQMDDHLTSIVERVIANGRDEARGRTSDEPDRSLTTLEFADALRRAAEQLCHVSALDSRAEGASWRSIGVAVGGITPQGAEHRFSPSAKERRSKASKAEWAHKERRAT